MELDIAINESNEWQATLKPIYVLPVRDENREYSDYLRKSYNDEIVIIKQN